jgi:hypothetical protein
MFGFTIDLSSIHAKTSKNAERSSAQNNLLNTGSTGTS